MTENVFDLYDREKLLLAEGQAILDSGPPAEKQAFAERLFDRFSKLVRENEDLTRHSDRQEQRLVKLNRNLKTQTLELEQQRSRLEGLSQQLAKYLQPESLTEYLNEYFSEMTQIALSYGATIDKYIGDAVMLFFGDPESKGVKEDARACVEMALEMQERMLVLQNRWRERGFENPFVIRIGINTGYCNVGNFGSDQRLSYTIIGGEVNVTQRLEANADPGGILISHETYVQVDDLVEVEERQAVNLKGIDRTIRTYAIKARKAESDKPLRLKHPQGVHIDLSPQYLNQDDRQWIALQLKQLATQLEQLNDKDASA